MATQIESRIGQASVDRYRLVEKEFWGQYGLDPEEHFVDSGVQGSRLRIQEVGSGAPVLFVHGTGGSGAYFAPLIAQLEGLRCLVLDRPGWGLSDPIDYSQGDYDEMVVEMLRNTVDALDIEATDVAGGSVGGTWVLRLAQAEPSRVGRIVWLGSTPLEELGVPTFIKLLSSPLGHLIVRLGERERLMRKQIGQIGHAATVASGAMDDFLHWRAVQAQEIHFLRSERAMVKAMRDRSGWFPGIPTTDADLAGLEHPVLLVYGSNDPLGTVELWGEKMRLAARGEFEVVPDAGHLPWYDAPVQVGEAVGRFFGA